MSCTTTEGHSSDECSSLQLRASRSSSLAQHLVPMMLTDIDSVEMATVASLLARSVTLLTRRVTRDKSRRPRLKMHYHCMKPYESRDTVERLHMGRPGYDESRRWRLSERGHDGAETRSLVRLPLWEASGAEHGLTPPRRSSPLEVYSHLTQCPTTNLGVETAKISQAGL